MKFRFLLLLIYAFTAQPSEEIKLKLESMLPPGVNLNFYERTVTTQTYFKFIS